MSETSATFSERLESREGFPHLFSAKARSHHVVWGNAREWNTRRAQRWRRASTVTPITIPTGTGPDGGIDPSP